MTLREFAAMGGFETQPCDPAEWGGPLSYRDGPNTIVCGFKSEAKALEHWLASRFSKEMIAALKALMALTKTARADALEEAAKVVEGETYEQIYVIWPQWSALGNRGRESTEAKLTACLAASIRSLTAPAVEKPGKYPRIEARPFNDPPTPSKDADK